MAARSRPARRLASSHIIIIVIVIVVLFLHTACVAMAAVDFNCPAVFNFGDSNSDTGARIAAGLESIGLPYGQTYFRRPAGRFCDGRLIIDFLCNSFLSHFLSLVLPAEIFNLIY